MTDTRIWILFDGDDTLWRTTPTYDRALTRLGCMLAENGIDAAEGIAWAAAHDVVQAQTMGYSMHRYPATLRDTSVHFLGQGEHAAAALQFGYDVFADIAEPTGDAAEVLELLSRTHRLALLTAGETTVQEKRIRDFPFSHMFDAVRIVPRKDVSVFTVFAHDFGMDPATSWMVGDSLRSDVVPAVGAGFNAIHYDTVHWAAYERAGHDLPQGAITVTSLMDAAKVILERKLDNVPGLPLPT